MVRGRRRHGMGAASGRHMSDDPNKQGQQDRSRINVNQPHELAYWTQALGISAERLREIVSEVGASASAVRERLGRGN